MASHQDSQESGKLIACLEQHLELEDVNVGGVQEIRIIIRGHDHTNLHHTQVITNSTQGPGDLCDEEITISQDAPS